jgi:hypothetical protein
MPAGPITGGLGPGGGAIVTGGLAPPASPGVGPAGMGLITGGLGAAGGALVTAGLGLGTPVASPSLDPALLGYWTPAPVSTPASVGTLDPALLGWWSGGGGLAIVPFPAGYDPDFVTGLNALVAIEFDRNARGAMPAAGGAIQKFYAPDPNYPGAYRCRVVQRQSSDVMQGQREGDMGSYRVLFANPLMLDRRYRLIVLDPVTLTPPLRPSAWS